MKNQTMNYKGYFATIEYSDDDKLFWGKVLGVEDSITFQGYTVDELRKDFNEALDGYLDLCKRIGKDPKKSFKGSFNVRISPELHREASHKAASQGKTLNEFVAESIEYNVKYDLEKIIREEKISNKPYEKQKPYTKYNYKKMNMRHNEMSEEEFLFNGRIAS